MVLVGALLLGLAGHLRKRIIHLEVYPFPILVPHKVRQHIDCAVQIVLRQPRILLGFQTLQQFLETDPPDGILRFKGTAPELIRAKQFFPRKGREALPAQDAGSQLSHLFTDFAWQKPRVLVEYHDLVPACGKFLQTFRRAEHMLKARQRRQLLPLPDNLLPYP